MQSEGEGLIPYAAPQCDVTPPGMPEPPLPRPASTKWLLGLQWFFALCTALMFAREYQQEGPAFLNHYNLFRVAFSSTLMVVTLIAFHAVKRSRITYTLGIAYLLLIGHGLWRQVSVSFDRVFAIWKYDGVKTLMRADVIIALLFTALFIYFCHRFTFGLPSRRFYNVTPK